MQLIIEVLMRVVGYILCFVSIAGMCNAATIAFLWARSEAKFPWKQPLIFFLCGTLFAASILLFLK